MICVTGEFHVCKDHAVTARNARVAASASRVRSNEAIALESGRLVLHKAASELLADPNIERLFLGGGHQAVTPAAIGSAAAPGIL